MALMQHHLGGNMMNQRKAFRAPRSSRMPKIMKEELRDCKDSPKEASAVRRVVIDQILREKILPDDAEFDPKIVDHIYVTRRNANAYSFRASVNEKSPRRTKLSRTGYEKDFYDRFWDRREKPIVFLIGQRGCGKSTFLEHFFRGDCYWFSKLLGTEREQDYRLKLRVHLNLRNEEGKAFSENFWEKARLSIEESFRKRCGLADKPAGPDDSLWQLRRHVDFWRRALDLDNPTETSLYRQRGARAGTSYEAEVLAASKHVPMTNEQWVRDALAFFRRNPQFFAFLVVVMDNLDQSPVDTQREAIRIAKGLVRDRLIGTLQSNCSALAQQLRHARRSDAAHY